MMMATNTRNSVRTRAACLTTTTTNASLRGRQAPSVRPSDRSFYDTTMQPREVAESDTRVRHWFAPPATARSRSSILGREGERIYVRVAPRRKSAAG